MKWKRLSEILEVEDHEVREVPCPEWDCLMYVRSVSADKKDRFDGLFARGEDGTLDLTGYRAQMVSMCLCDPKGNYLDPSPSEVKALGKKNVVVLDRLFSVCQELTRDNPDEELAKNSEGSAAGNGSG